MRLSDPKSLGPVPTKKQMELLKKLALPNATLHEWDGVRLNSGGAYIQFDNDPRKTETINRGTVGKFLDWLWVEPVGTKSGFRSAAYKISANGLKRIELGKTR